MTTLEQVEKLRERANVSYEEARAALDITDGDLLEAVIYLEKSGKIDRPHMSTYNTQTGGVYEEPGHQGQGYQEQAPGQDAQGAYWKKHHRQRKHRGGDYREFSEYDGPRFKDHMRNLWRGFCALIRKGNANHFVVTHEGSSFLRMPVTLFVLAILCFPWVSLPLLIIGLFCDCRYEFRGPNFKQTPINNVMDRAADTAENIKRSVVAEAAETGYEKADWERDDDD